jgi:hypothetical protein
LVLAIRLELFKRHVFLTPNVTECKREAWTEGGDEKKAPKRKALTDIMIEWTWRDGDTGETLVSRMPGCGEDASDKGIYKAITGCEKYLLLKTFLLPTYDDAEQMNGGDRKALQKRVGEEKAAELKATKAAREAGSEEEAKAEIKKGQILFISLPDRFHGEFAAVYGKPIVDAAMVNFFSDCCAGRFKAQEGIIYKLESQYANDCQTLAERLGYTVKREE